MKQEIHLHDVNTAIIGTIMDGTAIVNVSTATTKELKFSKPDGNTATKPATLTTDGTDGQIQYVSDSLFFDVAGTWKMQAHITMPGGEWRSDIQSFTVAGNL